MKVVVIGAGFFGLHIAKTLKSKFECQLTILEERSDVFLGAAGNNQCRLHEGFHYPRSGFTIYQSIMGAERFKKTYRESCFAIPENIYCIRTDGHVSPAEYLAVMNSFHLNYEVVDTPNYVKKPFDGLCIKVEEYGINLVSLKNKLLAEVGSEVIYNKRVRFIDHDKSIVTTTDDDQYDYDFLINATYTNPNLGLREDDFFKLKYEICLMVEAMTNWDSKLACTIMDGEYGSIYPTGTNTHTLSSVRYTPLLRGGEEILIKKPISKRFLDKRAKELVNHLSKYLDFDYSLKSYWVSNKAKLASDYGDSRVTEVRRNNNVFSVMCGKLDAAFSASDYIVGKIWSHNG